MVRTSNDHHADGKNLLVVGFSRNVSKTHGGHASHRKVKSSDIHRATWGARYQFGCGAGIGPQVAVRCLGNISQLPQPRILYPAVGVGSSYRVPLTQRDFLRGRGQNWVNGKLIWDREIIYIWMQSVVSRAISFKIASSSIWSIFFASIKWFQNSQSIIIHVSASVSSLIIYEKLSFSYFIF